MMKTYECDANDSEGIIGEYYFHDMKIWTFYISSPYGSLVRLWKVIQFVLGVNVSKLFMFDVHWYSRTKHLPLEEFDKATNDNYKLYYELNEYGGTDLWIEFAPNLSIIKKISFALSYLFGYHNKFIEMTREYK